MKTLKNVTGEIVEELTPEERAISKKEGMGETVQSPETKT